MGWEADVDGSMCSCDTTSMAVRLFMFLVHGVAASDCDYRSGARHALMIFATGPALDAAQSTAVKFVTGKGWTMIEPRRATEIVDEEIITDDTLRAAAESALEHGSAFVVYGDEIGPDA